ncbi:MAG TPA: NADH-quinone oxidoreductase subunit J [Nocardioidaceae bacterium]|nr:NADH-quinone oxidoreductase subunit J [Nocardioidaceae bacterium]
MSVVEVLFWLLSCLALGSAVLVVTTDHLVHAALWLVVTLGALAGCYLLLTAEFVAWVQVLIYVGAVVVLLLFALMLTRAPTAPDAATTTRNQPVAILAGVATTAVLGVVLVDGFRGAEIDVDGAPSGAADSIGDAIFRHWVLAFEVVSVVLLAALVGAIVLSRRDAAELSGTYGPGAQHVPDKSPEGDG